MSSECKRFTGTTELYHLLDLDLAASYPAHRPFLERNLQAILKYHKLSLQTANAAAQMTRQYYSPASTRASGVTEWQPPTEQCLTDIFRAQVPVLRIKFIQLENPHGLPGTFDHDLQRPLDAPAWLPDARSRRIRCTVTCGLYQRKPEGAPHSDTLHVQIAKLVLEATLTLKVGDNRTMAFEMEPFLFPLNSFSRQAVTEAFDAHCLIECESSAEIEEFLLPPGATIATIAGSTNRLSFKSKGRLSPGDAVKHKLKSYDDAGSTTALAGQLILRADWHRVDDSPLVIYQQAKTDVERSLLKQERATPPPPAANDKQTYQIVYVFVSATGQSKVISSRALRCIFCRHRLPHSSFERLHFHYLANHSHLDFAVKDCGRAGKTIYKSIQIELEDKSQRNAVGDEKELCWIRPPRPFDIGQYLKGDQSWVTSRPPRKPQPQVHLPPLNANQTAVTLVSRSGPRLCKKYPVPNIPGVTLYRNISKRHVWPGELLSESDDDIDPTWMTQQQRLRKIDDLPATLQHFIKLFDAHLDEAELNGDRYLADTLVRFCGQQQDQLNEPVLLVHLRTKLEQLGRAGLVSPATIEQCLDLVEPRKRQDYGGDIIMIDSESESDEVSSSTLAKSCLGPLIDAPVMQRLILSKEVHNKSFLEKARRILTDCPSARDDIRIFRARLEAEGPEAPRTPNSEEFGTMDKQQKLAEAAVSVHELPDAKSKPHAGRRAACLCGDIVIGARESIYCSEMICSRGAFHMRCVGMMQRDATWVCPFCR